MVVVEIRLDLVEGVGDGSAASQFFKSELFIFCPLSRTWSLDLIPPIFNDIPSANHLVNQSLGSILTCFHYLPVSTSALAGSRGQAGCTSSLLSPGGGQPCHFPLTLPPLSLFTLSHLSSLKLCHQFSYSVTQNTRSLCCLYK